MAFDGCCELSRCFRWVPSAVTRTKLTGELESSTLTQELQGLEALEYQMSKDLEMLRQRRENARLATTLKGRVLAIMGHGFAIYCVFRIVSVSVDVSVERLRFIDNVSQSVANLVGPVRPSDSTSTSSDMITQLLVYSVSLFPSINLPKDKVASVARQVSLVLIGAIILSSLRQIMGGVKRACAVLYISGTMMDIYKKSFLGAKSYKQKPWCLRDFTTAGADHGEAESRLRR